MNDADPVKLLEDFVIENDALLELEERIGKFNIFDALRLERVEIRHSNFLAWLLDPYESHGQGQLFLVAILMDIFRRCEKPPASPIVLDGADLQGVRVFRESKHHIDLLITCDNPPYVVAIENKVDSGQHSGQLDRYRNAVQKEFAGVPLLFVYLTPEEDDPERADWVSYGYGDIQRVLDRLRRTHARSLGGDVGTFLDHYINLIGSRIVEDPKIAELCQQIYTTHRRALDLIFKHAPVAGSEAVSLVIKALESRDEEWVIRVHRTGFLQFVPRQWVGVISTEDGLPVETAPCDVFFEFQTWGEERVKAAARFVVGEAKVPSHRESAIEMFKAQPYGLKMKHGKVSPKWTRLGSETLATWPEDEPCPTEELYQKFHGWLNRLGLVVTAAPSVLAEVARQKS